jgi:hypothetical protein
LLKHDRHPTHPIHIEWQRPVLPDRGPSSGPVESPLSRRLLEDLQLTRHDRLLAVDTRNPQFLELAADAVGPHGHITSIEHDLDRLHRARHRVAHLRCDVRVLPELPHLTGFRFDAIALVMRDGIVPHTDELRRLAGRLGEGGRLAVVSFEGPTGRIASSGTLRTSASDTNWPPRPIGGPSRHPSRADRRTARARCDEVTA